MKAISLKKSFCLDDLSTFIFAFFDVYDFFPTSKILLSFRYFQFFLYIVCINKRVFILYRFL